MEDKVTAIFALRDAAARHAKLEMAVGENPSGHDRDRLLDARIDLEQKTQQAVETCVHCGRPHTDDAGECAGDQSGTVIPVDFSREKRKKNGPENPGTTK
ncbi:MAG: hypothetical protein ACRENA_05815 [Vulcanimicrobiaceae bacterium]